MTYEYEMHVKIVGIVEIVLQVLSSILAFVLLIMLIFGASALTAYGNSPSDPNATISSGDATAAGGVLIAVIVILVLLVAFNAWLVYLVYTGGQTKNASRLNIWYIIQAVLLALFLLSRVPTLLSGTVWYVIMIDLICVIYRIYAIHVVRCHAAELKPGSQSSA